MACVGVFLVSFNVRTKGSCDRQVHIALKFVDCAYSSLSADWNFDVDVEPLSS